MKATAKPAVCVRWIDAVGEDARVDQDDIDAGKLDPLEMVSIGHVLRETQEYVVIAQDRYTAQGKLMWRNWMTIPRVCIQELAYLTTIQGYTIKAVARDEPSGVGAGREEAQPYSEEEAYLKWKMVEAQRALADYYERRNAGKPNTVATS